MLTDDRLKESDQANQPTQNTQDPAKETSKVEEQLIFPNSPLIYEVWASSNKIFELDIKTKSESDVAVSISASVQEKLHFKFAGDRKAPFEGKYTAVVDPEGKNKIYVQVATPESKSEIELQASFLLELVETGVSKNIPVVVRVVFSKPALSSKDL